jgi:elongation factor G
VLCAVGGVQSQSITVDRQMNRYHVPRLAFINKMDRTGADPFRVVRDMREKLGDDAILMQLPIGAGEKFQGIIDLVTMKAVYLRRAGRRDHPRGSDPRGVGGSGQRRSPPDARIAGDVQRRIDGASVVGRTGPEELIHRVTRAAVQQQDATPVFLGSAFRNKGVQLLLDAITRYLPSPLERQIKPRLGIRRDGGRLEPSPITVCGHGFQDRRRSIRPIDLHAAVPGPHRKGGNLLSTSARAARSVSAASCGCTPTSARTSTALRAGDIVAVMGVDSASGDTYAEVPKYCTLESMFVPEPVIKVAVQPESRADADKMSKALARFRKEDPTFRVFNDEETGEIILAGMGELHLDIYVERMRREYKVGVQIGAPKVSYREAPTLPADFDYKHRKQTGGSGQYAHIVGRMEPLPEGFEHPLPSRRKWSAVASPSNTFRRSRKASGIACRKAPSPVFPWSGCTPC